MMCQYLFNGKQISKAKQKLLYEVQTVFNCNWRHAEGFGRTVTMAASLFQTNYFAEPGGSG